MIGFKMIGFQNDWIPNFLDSKMIGMTYGLLRINRVNTMTPRQNDLVVKNAS